MRIIAKGGVVTLAYGLVICTGYEYDQFKEKAGLKVLLPVPSEV